MECEVPEYGRGKCPPQTVGLRAGERQLSGGDAGGLRLAARGDRGLGAPLRLPKPTDPIVGTMDEISYWVYTKQAPCLMNFDNVIKRQYEAAHTARAAAATAAAGAASDRDCDRGIPEPAPKKKKRKMSIMDEERISEKQQNVYFEASQGNERTVPSSCKSGTLESDIDFNIKNSSIQGKSKRMKIQKSGRTFHKKNKVVTSTPVRRSLRRAQNGTTNSQHLDISFESYNSNLNGNPDQSNSKLELKSGQRSKRSSGKALRAETSPEKSTVAPTHSKVELVANGQLEDLSDVSGFTANYIRSTKLHSNTKSSKTLRNKSSRQLVKESQQAAPRKDTTMLVCVNKSVNATVQQPQPSFLNCSTDSSQNVLNLVTTQHSNQQGKVNKSTSLLKFVNVKIANPKDNNSSQLQSSKESVKTDVLNSSPPKNATNSRYPRRHKYYSPEDTTGSTHIEETQTSLDKRKKGNRGNDLNISDQNEIAFARTRSGKNKSHLHKPASPLMVFSVTTAQTSSSAAAINVASHTHHAPRKSKSKRVSSNKYAPPAKTSMDQSDGMIRRDSVREQSGFAACFSDSDEGSEALKQRKFFC